MVRITNCISNNEIMRIWRFAAAPEPPAGSSREKGAVQGTTPFFSQRLITP
jgi:hypothetical protein